MKTAIATITLTLAVSTANADYLVKDNGEVINIPDDKVAIFVDKGTPIKKLYSAKNVRKVHAKRPTAVPESDAPECTPEGELSTGAPPCEE